MSQIEKQSPTVFRRFIEEKKKDIRLSLENTRPRRINSMNPPKRILKQMFKQFFENHIIICGKYFYCCCCQKFLDNHCAAFEHTSKTEHSKFIDRATAMQRSWILLSDKTNYKLLVSEGIISFDANNFKCRICNDQTLAISQLREHLQNFWHHYYSLKFDRTSIELLDSTSSVPDDLEQSCALVNDGESVCPECMIERPTNYMKENGHEETTTRYTRQSILPKNQHAMTGPKIRKMRSPLSFLQIRSGASLDGNVTALKCQNVVSQSEKPRTSPKIHETSATQKTESPPSIVQMETRISLNGTMSQLKSLKILLESKKRAPILEIHQTVASQETKTDSSVVQIVTEAFSSGFVMPSKSKPMSLETEKTATRPKISETAAIQKTESHPSIIRIETGTSSNRIVKSPSPARISSESEKSVPGPKILPIAVTQEAESPPSIIRIETGTSSNRIVESPRSAKISSKSEKSVPSPKILPITVTEETESPPSIIRIETGTSSNRIVESPRSAKISSENKKLVRSPKILATAATQETESPPSISQMETGASSNRIAESPKSGNIPAESKKSATNSEILETVPTQETKSPSSILQMINGTSGNGIVKPPTRFRRARYPRVKSIESFGIINSKSPEEASRTYLFWKQNFNTWLCKICNKIFTISDEISEHERETEHLDSYKKYGCENITMIEASVYKCACCSCTIAGRANVFAHLIGTRHSICLAAMLRDKRSEIIERTSTTNESEVSRGKKPELVIYVQHFQSLNVKKMERRRLRAQRQSAPMENFECNYCQLRIVKSDDFHSHLARHISLEFGTSNVDKNANDLDNFGLEEQSTSWENNAQPINQNSSYRNEIRIEKEQSNDFQVICTF